MSATFARVLSRADLLLFSVSALLALDTLASAASVGVSWFGWWAITLLFFFLPYGLMMAELGAAWPGEGGAYIWVREAMGARLGSLAAWFYWINNAYWIPSVYMVFASTFHALVLKGRIPQDLDEGPLATWLEAGIAIALTWITVWIGVIRLGVSKWLPNAGAVVKVSIFVALGVLGISSLLLGRPSANAFTWSGLVPRFTDSLAFLPVLLYNCMGFELMSAAGDEMKDPQRDVPRVILMAGSLIALLYVLGILGILLAVPLDKLSLVTGTWDALAVLGSQWGEAGGLLTVMLGVGFLYSCIGNIVTWSLGVNRVAAAAAKDGALPKALGRLHPRYNTPHVAFVAMGLIATLLLLGNAALSSNASNVFWMVFKLSGFSYFVPYLLIFPAFVVLRHKQPLVPRPYRMPGGMPGAWVASVFCTLFVALGCVLFFKPSPSADPATASSETWLLAGESLATFVCGLLLMPRARGGFRPDEPHRPSPRDDAAI